MEAKLEDLGAILGGLGSQVGGLEAILAPKGAPGTKSMPKEHSGFPPRGPSWKLFGTFFSIIVSFICLFRFLNDFSGIWLPFWLHVGSIVGDFWSFWADFLRKGRFYKSL